MSSRILIRRRLGVLAAAVCTSFALPQPIMGQPATGLDGDASIDDGAATAIAAEETAADTQAAVAPRTFYIDAVAGRDGAAGTSATTAWRSLAKLGAITLSAGDTVLLKRGGTYPGSITITRQGTATQHIRVDAYGSGALPKIDARGFVAAVTVRSGRYVDIANLEITSNEGGAGTKRYGVLLTGAGAANGDISIKGLYIHDIFAPNPTAGYGDKPQYNDGVGLEVQAREPNTLYSNLRIENNRIERVGGNSVYLGGRETGSTSKSIANVQIYGNSFINVGHSGVIPANVKNLHVRGNTFDRTGSSQDPRMHGRGSGIWPWMSRDVLIEYNKLMRAEGRIDSFGAHIDFGNRNVVIQYNLSVGNEGGFIEILGDNYNCAYRYNISINDGWRVDDGGAATHPGYIFTLFGFVGEGNGLTGPTNTYIYNNTIYMPPGRKPFFRAHDKLVGLSITNNIFHVLSPTTYQKELYYPTDGVFDNLVFKNNLYVTNAVVPANMPLKDTAPLYGAPQFRNPGGLNAEDYIPQNTTLIRNRGAAVTKIPGDAVGLTLGLAVTKDFFGNPIVGAPDIGAVEMP